MVKPPCYEKNKAKMKDGCWLEEQEDPKRLAFETKQGASNWTAMPKKAAGLRKCGKSCRIKWNGNQRPDLEDDNFTPEEEELIIKLHSTIGSRWTIIAQQLPGRTDNDVKNLWNTKLKKKLSALGIDPVTHRPFSQILADYGNISGFPKGRTRFGCLSRDMKNAFNMKPELYNHGSEEMPSSYNSHFSASIAPLELETSTPQQHFFSNDHLSSGHQSLDLLSQLQAIKMVTEATDYNGNCSQQMQIECTYSSASSSSPESTPSATNLAAIASPGFSWCDFLLEDAYASTNTQEQGNSFIFPPTDEQSSIQVQNTSDEAKEEMNVLLQTAEASNIANASFVENMLQGENDMLSDFHGLLEEPFYY